MEEWGVIQFRYRTHIIWLIVLFIWQKTSKHDKSVPTTLLDNIIAQLGDCLPQHLMQGNASKRSIHYLSLDFFLDAMYPHAQSRSSRIFASTPTVRFVKQKYNLKVRKHIKDLYHQKRMHKMQTVINLAPVINF